MIDVRQFEEFFTMIFMHTMIQVMTYIEGRGVMRTKTFLLMTLIIIKSSYRHLEEKSTKYENHFDFLSNLNFKTVILFLVQFQG